MKYPKVEIIYIGNKFRDIEFTTSLGDELKFDKPRKLYPLRGSDVTESALGTRMLRTNRCAVDNGARENKQRLVRKNRLEETLLSDQERKDRAPDRRLSQKRSYNRNPK